jgi:hypothetical protein
VLVVCEGQKTEPLYVRAFARAVRNPLVHVEIDDRGGVPKTLVERAKALKQDAEKQARRQRDENLRFDEVWCVFDVDEHPHLADARQQARDNQIQLAISNPCFELWALLHLQEQNAAIHRKKLRSAIKSYFPRYEKTLPFEELHQGYADAVARARRLEDRARRAGDSDRNPTTAVYRLTERIKNYRED